MKNGGIDGISVHMMKLFITVADCRSFSQAANTLYISQSVVSRNIKSLEDSLELELLRRTSRGIVLTREGKTLYGEFRRTIDELQETVRRVKFGRDADEKTIRIGCLDTDEVAAELEHVLDAYRKTDQDMVFRVRYFDSSGLRENLMCHDLHCIITYSIGFGALRDVETKRIKKMDSYFCVSAKNPMAQGAFFDASSLSGQTLFLISIAEMDAAEQRALDLCKAYGIEPKIK